MKNLTAIIMAMSITCACTVQNQTEDPNPIGQPDIKIENGSMTPEVLWAFGRIGNGCISPDGKQTAFTVTYYDITQNKSNPDIYIMNTDGADKTQLTRTAAREGSLAWHPDGSTILFLREGVLWSINPVTREEKQISAIDQKIDDYLLAPTGQKVAFAITTKLEKYQASEIYSDLDKANARMYDDLMYRHWDSWKDGSYSHIYIGNIDADSKVTQVEDIMPGEPYDSPTKPFGGMEDVAWHPDGKSLVYTSKKLTGKDYAFQTNSNLYRYDLETGQTRLLTPDMPGYDKHPLFSPDGSKLIWLSMERAGFEADKERILMLDLKTNERKDLSEKLDASPGSLQWTADSKTVYFTAPYQETCQLFKLTPENGEITRLTTGDHDYQNVQIINENAVLATHTTSVKPAEIYRIDLSTGAGTEISFVNKELLDRLNKPTLEKRFVTTTDNKQMVTWVIYPPDFDKNKKYPMLLMCTGGPQGVLSPSFSYRWNYMLMASQGYVVAVPARRGTSGSGQEWNDAISKNHGTQDEQDLLAAVDALGKEPWIDENRIGAMGASYGGYSVFHLAGTHRGRFKAFLAHCGIFNMEFMYTTTEEMFFEEWETGGAPWDKDNKAAQNSYAHSPHLLVKNWDTPIMIVHGEKDFRVPYSQGMAAFNTAQMLGVASKLLIFPAENHWVLSPQNAIVWQREFFKWFDKYLK
ncbi:MAG: S9 family peptidase [Tannerella sp.]|jgi:dipeptidyl aminopeptidase/acylaminoacyl peptidase|nr:S9 family peptidase [Tannerella sp.]